MVDPRTKNILIVEDDESVASMLSFALKNEGFRTDIAEDGEKAQSLTHLRQPSLILLDMMLPKKSGLETLKYLQTDEYKNIPVIVVTGKPSTREMVQFEPNVKEFMQKPLDMEKLISKIHSMLGTTPPAPQSQETGQEKKEELNPWAI